MVARERGVELGVAGRFAPRVDPDEVVLARRRAEPVGERGDGFEPLGERLVLDRLGEHGRVEGGGHELLAGREVVADEPVHDAHLGGDVAQRHAREAVARDQPQRRGDDLLASLRRIESGRHPLIVRSWPHGQPVQCRA